MRAHKPLVLVTNDDGVLADGIARVAEALATVGDVVVCAPSRQQSAVSHGISLNEPLRVRTLGPGRYAVTGTPADAVFIGISEICKREPALIVSGINHGTNLGTDVLYSGTVAGAMEGALRGIPGIAVSQQLPSVTETTPQESDEYQKANPWDPLEHLSARLERLLEDTARFTAALARAVLAQPLPKGVVLNVNAPERPSGLYSWTRLGHRMYRAGVIRRVDPRGVPYYWIGNSVLDGGEDAPGTDAHALAAGMFSVTPIRLDWNADDAHAVAWPAIEGFSGVAMS